MNTGEQISLFYRGGRVEQGRMDAYEVASSILAFSDFLGVISRTQYGDRIELKTEIQGFQHGSFGIQFAIDALALAQVVMACATPESILATIQQCLALFKHLDGMPPKNMTIPPLADQRVAITNQNGEINYFTANVINIISDQKAAKAVEQFVRKPLSNNLERLEIMSSASGHSIVVPSSDADAYQPVDLQQPLREYEVEMGLVIEAPVFKDGNKWKFYDGQTSFWAEVSDQKFLAEVDAGTRRFGKGDILIVRVRVVQVTGIGTINTQRAVVEVIDHRPAATQHAIQL